MSVHTIYPGKSRSIQYRERNDIAATAAGATIGTIAVIRKVNANKAAVL